MDREEEYRFNLDIFFNDVELEKAALRRLVEMILEDIRAIHQWQNDHSQIGGHGI